MSAKRKHRTTNEYLKYLKGELSREERYSFERDLEADPFEMEAMQGMEQFNAGELEEDLLSIHASLHKRLRRKRRRTVYSFAAAIASILIVGTVFLNIYNIDPESASESIPNEESFLHEDAGVEAEAPGQEKKSEDRIIPLEEDDEAQAPEEGQIREMVSEMETPAIVKGVQVQDEAQVQEEAQDQMKAQLREEAPIPDNAMVLDEEVEVPAPVTRDVVAVEAQPKRSRKKESPPEAAVPYTANRVSGIVVSAEDQEPLPGASILVKGSDSGMVADMDGRFSLMADEQTETTVIASYVGMESSEYQLAGGKENRVVLQPDMATLDEVVLIGNSDENKEEFNYSGAEPEGGLEAYEMYIEEQLRFPAGAISKKEVVVLKFKVEQDGTISNIQTLRSPGVLFTEEAIRLLHEGPGWKPARNESGVTDDDVRMRIVFKRQ